MNIQSKKTEDTHLQWDHIYQKYPLKQLPWGQEPTPQLAKLIESGVVEPGAVLDIGCGAGTNTIYLSKQGFCYHGIDLSPTAIKIAQEKTAKETVSCGLVLGSATRLPYLDGSFNLVFDKGCFYVLSPEHREAYVREIYRVLKPKGKYQLISLSSRTRFVIKTPRFLSPKGLWRYFKSYILGVDEVLRLHFPLSVEELQRYFSPTFKIHYIHESPEKGMKYYRLEALMEKIP